MRNRAILSRLHIACACSATVTLVAFWSATAVAELFLSHAAVAQVKQAILLVLPAFIALIALTGASGYALGGKGGHPLLSRKRRRMALIGANGLLVLVPCAIFLAGRARADAFDGIFYGAQALELVAGALNLALMGANIRDGVALGQGRRARRMATGTSRGRARASLPSGRAAWPFSSTTTAAPSSIAVQLASTAA